MDRIEGGGERHRDDDRQEGQQQRREREPEQLPRRRGVNRAEGEREEDRDRGGPPMRCADVRRNVQVRRDYI